MSPKPARLLSVLRVDAFTLVILGAAVLATLAPPSTAVADAMKPLTGIGVAVVFFLHGARLSPNDVIQGLRLPRLHLATLGLTYAAFPLAAWAMSPFIDAALGPRIAEGFIFLAALPSTVQSSVSFVAIAGGNVAAAVAAAALSNLAGVFLTPLVLALTLAPPGAAAGGTFEAILQVASIILAPFAVGQLLGRLLRPFLVRHRSLVGLVDRGVIALLVYQAIGQSVVAGLWNDVPPLSVLGIAVAAMGLLAVVGGFSTLLSRVLRLAPADATVLTYCGSKKSLASGMPMLRVLYGTSPAAGSLALPVIIFHQLQLMIFSSLATRTRARLARTLPRSDIASPDSSNRDPYAR